MHTNSLPFGDGDSVAYLPMLVSSDADTRVLIGETVFLLVETLKGRQIETPIALASGRTGTQIFKEDWTEILRFPNGDVRRMDADVNHGYMRIVARACDVKITTPDAPKISKREIKHASEVGVAKTDCMVFNEKYDRFNRIARVGNMFDRPGAGSQAVRRS
jgi:hypothetical protein